MKIQLHALLGSLIASAMLTACGSSGAKTPAAAAAPLSQGTTGPTGQVRAQNPLPPGVSASCPNPIPLITSAADAQAQGMVEVTDTKAFAPTARDNEYSTPARYRLREIQMHVERHGRDGNSKKSRRRVLIEKGAFSAQTRFTRADDSDEIKSHEAQITCRTPILTQGLHDVVQFADVIDGDEGMLHGAVTQKYKILSDQSSEMPMTIDPSVSHKVSDGRDAILDLAIASDSATDVQNGAQVFRRTDGSVEIRVQVTRDREESVLETYASAVYEKVGAIR